MVVGLDISKTWFQVHGVTEDGEIIRRKLARGKVLDFFSRFPSSVVGLEACGSAHHWARELAKLGHEPKLMPARYVRAYVKTNKHDAADAEACWEAVQRPGMRFVPLKSVERQGMLMLHRTRDLLTRQRTGAVNALRGHLAEFGIIAPKGRASVRDLMDLVGTDERIPECARGALLVLSDQIREIERNIERYDQAILTTARDDEVCRRLMKVTTIGPFAATALGCHGGRSEAFFFGATFCGLAGIGAKAALDRRQGTARRDQASGVIATSASC